MLLSEIKEQVERWMESKSGELKKQQEALKQETDTQIQNMDRAYRQQAAAEREMLRAERERMKRENDTRVQRMEEMQETAESAKKEMADVLRQQKIVTDQERKALNEREAAIGRQKQEFERTMAETRDEIQRTLKKKADAGRINELEEEVEGIKRGQTAGRLVPMILSIAAITLLILAAVAGFLIMKGKLADNQEKMNSMQAKIDELSITPEPTPVPTPEPTPIPTEVPTPTPDPVEEALRESVPGVLDWEESETGLPLENAEIVRTYRNDKVFVSIVADEHGAIKEKETELYKQFGFSIEIPTPEPAAEPSEELTTTEESADQTLEPNEEPAPEQDPKYVVLETVQINEQYVGVFFVQQKEAKDVDYREALNSINHLFEGQSGRRTTFIAAYKNGGYGGIVNDAWSEGKIYPIPEAFVPENLVELVSIDTVSVPSRVWMYHYGEDRFVYIVNDNAWAEANAYEKALSTAFKNAGLPYTAILNNEQVIAFFAEDADIWYEDLAIYQSAVSSK